MGLKPKDLIGDKAWEIFAKRRSLQSALLAELKDIGAFGEQQVRNEMGRQPVAAALDKIPTP